MSRVASRPPRRRLASRGARPRCSLSSRSSSEVWPGADLMPTLPSDMPIQMPSSVPTGRQGSSREPRLRNTNPHTGNPCAGTWMGWEMGASGLGAPVRTGKRWRRDEPNGRRLKAERLRWIEEAAAGRAGNPSLSSHSVPLPVFDCCSRPRSPSSSAAGEAALLHAPASTAKIPGGLLAF